MPRLSVLVALALVALAAPASAQHFPTDDPVIRAMWTEGMERSQTEPLAHHLIDVIGPRLAGSPGLAQAQDWLLETYAEWGVPARREAYGTWNGWQPGALHVEMTAPRVQPLVAELLAWSPATRGPVEGPVVMPPPDLTPETADAWLATLDGAFVLLDAPQPTCRAAQEMTANARPETIERLDALRDTLRADWSRRWDAVGNARERTGRLEAAGIAGTLGSRWSGGWGANKVFSTANERAVGLDVSCEDYGLLARLAASGHAPRIRVDAEAEDLGIVPQFNVIAEMRGTELPDEYVLLSAHLDSWHAATGATDNGTGTLTMLEAMRILKATYPNPRRTILVGHWGAEEMGLIGSGSFREDHPEVVAGLQVGFNQDNGTWRVERIEGQGFLDTAAHLPMWMAAVPTEIQAQVTVEVPGEQNNRGSDHTSFVCAEAPVLRLQSPYDEYRQYTWHTNLDTYDKIIFDDLKQNATLAAMLVYGASEDPERMTRELAILPDDPRTGEPRTSGPCFPPRREPRD
ncbi:M20/M25/M40 family metallo-hydrolase [Rubrivirga sp. IMCC43871]|uniref:M20/M25/M40 family metallo-hydrolase n=1 Tax=Rubrivirga sp. IMCC43871 TaxID=3391575 RepID=UPI00398FB72F